MKFYFHHIHSVLWLRSFSASYLVLLSYVICIDPQTLKYIIQPQLCLFTATALFSFLPKVMLIFTLSPVIFYLYLLNKFSLHIFLCLFLPTLFVQKLVKKIIIKLKKKKQIFPIFWGGYFSYLLFSEFVTILFNKKKCFLRGGYFNWLFISEEFYICFKNVSFHLQQFIKISLISLCAFLKKRICIFGVFGAFCSGVCDWEVFAV
jgi:hypothetical protein